MAGGCGRKVELGALSELLANAGIIRGTVPDAYSYLVDAERVALRQGDASDDCLTVTVDLVYEFGSDARRFGEIAAVHSMSDIFASLSIPRCGIVTLGVTTADLRSGRAADALRGVVSGLSSEGASLAGGHTVFATEMFAGVTVIGGPAVSLSHSGAKPGDHILTSKPIGTGIALSAAQLGAATEEQLEQAYQWMLRSNAKAATLLGQAEQNTPGSVRAVTDVSGFGMLAAVRTVVGSLSARIEFETVPVLQGAEEWICAQAVSSLGDANLVSADEFTEYAIAEPFMAQTLLNDPQTSGGLLAVVAPFLSADLTASTEFAKVGRVESTEGGVRVIVEETARLAAKRGG